MGFNTREDAFDLKSCLAEIERARDAEATGIDRLGLSEVPDDLLAGLKPGQKISIKIGSAGAGAAHAPGGGASASAATGTGRLAAPGAGVARLAPPSATPAASVVAPARPTPAAAAPTLDSSWETF